MREFRQELRNEMRDLRQELTASIKGTIALSLQLHVVQKKRAGAALFKQHKIFPQGLAVSFNSPARQDQEQQASLSQEDNPEAGKEQQLK